MTQLQSRLTFQKKSIVSGLIEETVQRYGRIDVLVNNVGIQQAVSFEQTSIEEWYKITGVDLTRPFVCSREAVKHMEKQEHDVANRGGCIINISSVHQTYPNRITYLVLARRQALK